jgi:hypothetical protein
MATISNLHSEMYTVQRYGGLLNISNRKIQLDKKHIRTVFIYDYKNKFGHDLVYSYDGRIMRFEGECFSSSTPNTIQRLV